MIPTLRRLYKEAPAMFVFAFLLLMHACLTPVYAAMQEVGVEPGEANSWLATFWPVIAVAVPLLVSMAWQAAKKTIAKPLDRLSPTVQGFAVAVLSAGIGALAAHFGADLTGVELLSPEAITVIIMQALAPESAYNVFFRQETRPALARR